MSATLSGVGSSLTNQVQGNDATRDIHQEAIEGTTAKAGTDLKIEIFRIRAELQLPMANENDDRTPRPK